MARHGVTRAGVACIVALALLAGVQPADAGGNIRAVGTLERFNQEVRDTFPELLQGSPFESRMLNGTLLAVPQAHQLWQLYRATAFGWSGVLVRDDRTLEVIGSFRIDTLLQRATFSVGYGGEWLHTFDGGRRVFLVGLQRRLYEVDTVTLAVRDAGELAVSVHTEGTDPLAVGGFTWDEATGKLLVLYGGPPNGGVANRVTVLQEYDLERGTRVNRVVRSCTGALPATDLTGDTLATVPLADADAIYVPCQKDTNAPGLGLSSSSIVVRVPRASLADPNGEEASVVVGGPMDTALIDPAAGRMTVLDHVGRMTVVDVRAMAVLGSFDAAVPGGTGRVGPGFDSATGRVYFQSDLGLGWVDARGEAPFVPMVEPSLNAPGQEAVVTVGKLLYVLPGQALERPEQFTVYKAP